MVLSVVQHRSGKRGLRLRPLWSIVGLIAVTVSASAQPAVHVRSKLLNSAAAFSFPEKVVTGPRGEVYVLDTNLSSVFRVDSKNGQVSRVCGPESLSAPSDLAVDPSGNIWILSGMRSKVLKLNQRCEIQTEITSRRLPIRIDTNTFGELILLTGAGDSLFELYGSAGNFIRRFGKRLEYKDDTTNAELSDGRLSHDRAGGFFFSFNYPPLIRHYSRSGDLLGEFKPASDVAITAPDISVQTRGNSMTVRARYQILVLDMAADARGHLYVLLSGKNKAPALLEGANKLAMLSTSGRLIKQVVLDDSFHRLSWQNNVLYLLRNRSPLRLDTYAPL